MMQHIIVSMVLVVTLILMANPFDFWMPTEYQYVVAGALAVIVSIYMGLVYRDEGRDEREIALRGMSARVGYLSGVIVLSLSVMVSLVTGDHPSVWVIVTLAVMILVRLIARLVYE